MYFTQLASKESIVETTYFLASAPHFWAKNEVDSIFFAFFPFDQAQGKPLTFAFSGKSPSTGAKYHSVLRQPLRGTGFIFHPPSLQSLS